MSLLAITSTLTGNCFHLVSENYGIIRLSECDQIRCIYYQKFIEQSNN